MKPGSLATAQQSLVRSFLQSYPEEAAGVLEKLSLAEIWGVLKDAPGGQIAQILTRLNPELSLPLIGMMDDSLKRETLSAMEPIAASSLVERMEEDERERLLQQLPLSVSKELRQLLSYPPDSAGHYMNPRVVVFRPGETVEDALSSIRSHPERKFLDIILVDNEGFLVGMLPLRELALADPAQKLSSLELQEAVSVQATAPRDEVVDVLERAHLSSLPVVDFDGKLLGVIRYDALVAVAQQQASVDIQSMVGASPEERALSKASYVVRKRLPWLYVNLVTAFIAAAVVAIFEGTIAQFPVLAVLLPIVAGQSGNTGAQSLAVTLRGLALREIRIRHWLQVLRKEIAAGLINALAIALVTAVGIYMWSHSVGLGVVIGLSMVISLLAACVAGASIPVLLTSLGQDPAQSSSIILTTVTDVVGFLSFLGLATMLSDLLVGNVA